MFIPADLYLLCLAAAAALPRRVLADQFSDDYDKYNNAEYGKRPTQAFVSNPDVVAPLLQVNAWDEDRISPTGGSHIFLRHDYERSSPLVLSAADLSVVYMDRSFDRTSDIRVQQNHGASYLTFFSGSIVDGHGWGDGVVLDAAYGEAYRVDVQNLSVKNDLHEFEFTGDGTALLTAYDEVPMDLRPYRGSRRGRLLDGVFQEVDLETQEVLFQWRASEHVDLRDSYYKMERKWDFFHINSIQKSRAGNYLISARHMHSIYLINGQTGDIMWTLGGRKNQFTELPPAAGDGSANPSGDGSANPSGDALLTFAWQHHARFFHDDETQLTFFDNHALTTEHGCTHDCSRGLHVQLDLLPGPEDLDEQQSQQPTARILHEYRHPRSLQAQSQGSVQPLADGSGNVFVGWGRCPSFTEHAAAGEAVMDVQFSPWHTRDNAIALDNYRAYRMNWTATPSWAPDVAARRTEEGEDEGAGQVTTTVYASWNGATEVKAWAFLASNESMDLYGPERVVGIVPRDGFETSLTLPPDALHSPRFARAAALDASWNVLASTGILDIDAGTVFGEVPPVAGVRQSGSVVVTDGDVDVDGGGGGGGYSWVFSMGAEGEHLDFPGQSGSIFGVPVGWHTGLGFFLLLGLWMAARYF